jgi:hydroxymethylpyrimidine/phosphomethylpyrimidine kinase
VAIESTPVLPVLDMAVSTEFYERAGFSVRVYEGGGYAFVTFDDDGVFDLGLEPVAAGAGCYLDVSDVDEWHSRLAELEYPVTPLQDEPYGMREFTLTDPTGNRLRFGCGIAD